ncbi:uncharacterized protein LOC130113051 [Lampris incognitus]|uniref:uncharacterized protein LOC130113051 n=1 Tax=Lampris incognitus TaxID=2546036 RepID=UPI0024B4CA88|nr:uncharacterized protein LOC130113051 [Lampris incognitus]
MMYPIGVGSSPRRPQRDFKTKQWADSGERGSHAHQEPPASMGWQLERELHNTSSHERYSEECAGLTVGKEQDLNGDQLTLSAPDQELARKRKELQEIEEKIVLKKAAIGLKKVEPFLKMSHLILTGEEEKDFSHSRADLSGNSNELFTQLTKENGDILSFIKKSASFVSTPAQKGTTLRDRVNLILQRRWPQGHSSKSLVQSSTGANSFTEMSKQEDHPLKLRVKLMKKRCSNSWAPQVPDSEPHLSSQCPTSTVEEENTVAKGFQRFLGVLNKGVDVSLLTRIVNDDSIALPLSGEPLHTQPPFLKSTLQAPSKSESQGSYSGAPQLDCSLSKSRERSAEHLNHWGSHKDKHNLPDEQYVQIEGEGGGHFGSRSRSRSPPAVEEKEVRLEEQQGQVRLKEQQGQLQNILETLGLSIDADELNRLTERTQERLYGKKEDDGQRGDDSQERDRCQTSPQRIHRHSSSSTAVSGSVIPNLAPVQRSLSNVSEDSRKEKLTSEISHSRERGGNGDRDVDGINSKESSLAENPYLENTTGLYPHHAAQFTFPEYSSAQYYSYAAYQSGAFNGANLSAWQHTTHTTTPYPSHPTYPYSQYPLHQFTSSTASPDLIYPCLQPKKNLSFTHSLLTVKPNLAKNKGKHGNQSKLRRLTVIKTQQSRTKHNHLIHLTKSETKLKKSSKAKKRQQYMKNRRTQKRKEKRALKKASKSINPPMGCSSLGSLGVPMASSVAKPETQESECDKLLTTEEDVKANLKKKVSSI